MQSLTLLGPGSYSFGDLLLGPWQPLPCSSLSLQIMQATTIVAGQTAVISGALRTSQDGVNWRTAETFRVLVSFTDVTVLNKNGQVPVPASHIVGTPYAPYLAVKLSFSGTVLCQGILLQGG